MLGDFTGLITGLPTCLHSAASSQTRSSVAQGPGPAIQDRFLRVRAAVNRGYCHPFGVQIKLVRNGFAVFFPE